MKSGDYVLGLSFSAFREVAVILIKVLNDRCP